MGAVIAFFFRWQQQRDEVRHDDNTSLPQNDPQRTSRLQMLDGARVLYEIDNSDKELPVKVLNLPPEEDFSCRYKVFFVWEAALLLFGTIQRWLSDLIRWFKPWKAKLSHLDELKQLYKEPDFPEPKYAIAFWKEDWFFAYQRLAGPCPNLIHHCKQIPDRLAVEDIDLTPFGETSSLQVALEDGKLFYCDLRILEDIPHKKDYTVCAPILLLYRTNSGQLLPVAIQLFQEPGPDNPVFLPSDDQYVWLLAKMWYNQAETTYHQSVAHLGITHLLMEGVDLVTHRQLSVYHPIYKLLAPHLFYTMTINQIGRELLLRRGAFDTLMSSGVKGVKSLIAKSLRTWRLDVDGTLPEDLRSRGVDSADVLGPYYYRDDAMKVYNAIKTYVSKYVPVYYKDDIALLSDVEIQAWATELVKDKSDGGIGMKGVPGEGTFRTLDQLIQTLTSVIFTCSVQHAAVNFTQYDNYSFPPAYPSTLIGSPPKDKRHPRTMEDVLAALPGEGTMFEMILVADLLSTKKTNGLGDFETVYIQDQEAVQILQEFRMELAGIAQSFTADNKQSRVPPYDALLPQNIPNSVSI